MLELNSHHRRVSVGGPSLADLAALTCALLVPIALATPAAAQQTRTTADANVPLTLGAASPREDAPYVGVPVKTTVTQRFEIYNPHSADELQAVKDMGFTQVILDWPNLYDEAAAMGLDVVTANWWTQKTSEDEIDQALKVAGQVKRSRLAGISMMDEPGRNSPETPADFYAGLYERLRRRLDRELPGVTLEISHWGPLASWGQIDYYLTEPLYRSADVMRIMPYPDLHEGPLNEVFLMMQRSRSLMAKVDRELPLLVILQAWTLPPKSELPTIAELRVMAYQAMLAGASTLSFYHYRPEEWARTPGFHAAFGELMNELTQMSRRFAEAHVESAMTRSGVLESIVTLPSSATVRIRVNTNRQAVDGLAALAVEETTLRAPSQATRHQDALRLAYFGGSGQRYRGTRTRLSWLNRCRRTTRMR